MRIEFKENSHDFGKLSKSEPHPKKRILLIALEQLKKGTKINKVAESLGVNRHTVGIWYRRYKKNGLAGLIDKPKSGRPPKLKKEKEQEFINKIALLQDTRSGGRTTGNDIRKLAECEFGVIYADDTIYKVLKRLNFSWITARSKHPKSDLKTQETFKKTLKKRFC
ncbi:MAG: IS630 family transposase [bacterium]